MPPWLVKLLQLQAFNNYVSTNCHAHYVPNQSADETKLKMMQEVSENFEVSLICFTVNFSTNGWCVDLVVSESTGKIMSFRSWSVDT